MHPVGALLSCTLWMACACGTEVYPPSAEPSQKQATPPSDTRFVIFMIDGPRYSETFGDPTHAHVPGMWNSLRPLGTLCSNFQNLGETLTNPGHATVLTGIWQHIDNTGGTRPPNPTLFEYFRKATGVTAQDAMMIGGKTKLGVLTYSTDPGFGAAYGATPYVNSDTDYQTYDDLIARLDTDSPHLVMVSFSDVDQAAHTGVWNDYLNAIDIVDSLAVLTWNHLQANPDYAGKTYMFITADHGRHDDAHGGFTNHGDGCPGCRHLIFMALGPDIRPGYEVTSPYTQQDICNTVGAVLAVPTTYSPGIVMQDIFAHATAVLH